MSGRSAGSRRRAAVLLAAASLALGSAGAVWLRLGPAPRVPDKSSTTSQLSDRLLLGFMACKLFIEQSGGVYPEHLEQLVEEGLLPDPGELDAPPGVPGFDPGQPAVRLLVPGQAQRHLVPWEPVLVTVATVRDGQWLTITADARTCFIGPDLYDPESGVKAGAIDRYRDWR